MFADADSYERFMGRWSAALAPMLVDFAGLPASGRILDIGCGTGSLSFAIADRKPGCSVVGVDAAEAYVSFASGRNPWPDRVSFQVGDAQRLDLPDRAFDACASLLVWNFFPDPERAIAEAMRVSKPSAPVAAATWDLGGGMQMLRVFWTAVSSLERSSHFDEVRMPLCREGNLARLWRDSGLRDVRDGTLDFVMRFASFADYWDPFLYGEGPAGAYVRALDDAGRERIRDAVKRVLAVTAENVPIEMPARAWTVIGRTPGA